MADRMFPCAPRSLGGHRGLSGTQLKLLALALMLLDHIHYFFAFTGAVPLWFTQLGRLSAPLFLFCTVEGFAHTRDRRRYFGRIWAVAAGMGLVQFCMQYAGLWRRPDGFVPENGIFLNFVVLLPLWQGVDWLRQRRFARGLTALLLPLVGWPAAFLVLFIALGAAFPAASPWPQALFLLAGYTVLPCWILFTDGGIYYILLGLALYLLRGAPRRAGRRLCGAGAAVWPGLAGVPAGAGGLFCAGGAGYLRFPVDGRVCRGTDAAVQRPARPRLQGAVLRILPRAHLPAVCAELVGGGAQCVTAWWQASGQGEYLPQTGTAGSRPRPTGRRERGIFPWTPYGANPCRAACMPPLRIDQTPSQRKNRIIWSTPAGRMHAAPTNRPKTAGKQAKYPPAANEHGGVKTPPYRTGSRTPPYRAVETGS